VVLSTVTHLNGYVVRLSLDGLDDPLEPTRTHRLYANATTRGSANNHTMRGLGVQLDRSAFALGLYDYGKPHPGNALFGKYYSVATDLFQSLGIQPTFIGVQGEGYSGKFTKFGGKSHMRLLQSDFRGITILSLVANPSTSDSPAYDSFAMTSLGYLDSYRELLLCFVVNESFLKLRSERCDALVDALARFHHWDFGYGFSANAADNPEFHILGISNGRLSKEDERSLSAWYATPVDVRVNHLRDVYAYNLLNEQQLHEEIGGGVSLMDFIGQHAGCTLRRLTNDGLYEWKVSDDTVLDRLRKKLHGLPIMVR
jgi:hypothetical protein